ncbi:hypothetical protein [Novosphingobium colocasiae]|uniref:hypothetical protein n=1 Tax=Novosphingobium colocasiae TaxID=1256513 RepID=UPI0035B2126D
MTQISAQPPAQALNVLPIGTSGVRIAGGEIQGFSAILDGIGLPLAVPAPGLADFTISHVPAVLSHPGGNGGKASGKILPGADQAPGDDLPSIEAPVATAMDPAGVLITLAAIAPSSHLPPSAAGIAPVLPTAASPPLPQTAAAPVIGSPQPLPGAFSQPQPAVTPPVLGPVTVAAASETGSAYAPAEVVVAQQAEPGARPARPVAVPREQASQPDSTDRPTAVIASPAPAPLMATGAAAFGPQSAPDALPPAPAAPSGTAVPQDFDTLVSRLVEAREAASPQVVRTSLLHAELGTIGLKFRHEAGGLSVTLASGQADLAGSVQAALAAGPAPDAGDNSTGTGRQQQPSHHYPRPTFASQQDGVAHSGGGQGGASRNQSDGGQASTRDQQSARDGGPASSAREGAVTATGSAAAAERRGGIYA